MDIYEFCDTVVDYNIKIEEEISQGFNNKTYKAQINNKNVFIKYDKSGKNKENIKRGYKVTDILSSVDTQKPIEKYELDESIMVIYEFENTRIPLMKNWSSKDFCKNIIDTMVDFFNKLHTNKKIKYQLNTSKFDKRNEIIETYSRYIDESEDCSVLDNRIIEECYSAYDYLKNNEEYNTKFNHNDISLGNFGLDNGIYPVLDWERCGFSDPLYDISRFETGVIDEIIKKIHSSEFYTKIRNRFREELCVSIDMDRYRCHKLLNIVRQVSYIDNGQCSKYWLKIGTQNECLDMKLKQVNKLI